MAKGYDPRCGELAEVFLPTDSRKELVEALAQHIQDSIEAWLEEERAAVAATLARQTSIHALEDEVKL